MPIRLSVYADTGPVVVHRLAEGRDHLIGRGTDCDVQVVDDRVSRRHARLSPRAGGAWHVCDLGSKNGLLVEGERVEELVLSTPAWISLGGVAARFEPVPESRLEEEGNEELRRRRTAARLQRSLDPGVGLGPLLDRVLDSVMSMAGAGRGFLLLTRADGNHSVVRVAGLAVEDLEQREFEGSFGAVEQALATQRPVVCCDARADHLLGERPSVLAGGIRSLACLPLSVAGRVLGVVYADSRNPGRALNELDLEILESLVDHAALGLAVHDLNREVQDLRDDVEGPADPGTAPVAASTVPGEDPVRSSGSWHRLTAAHRRPPSGEDG